MFNTMFGQSEHCDEFGDRQWILYYKNDPLEKLDLCLTCRLSHISLEKTGQISLIKKVNVKKHLRAIK